MLVEPTNLASAVGVLDRTARSYGLDPIPLFRAVDIDPRLLDRPHDRVPLGRMSDVWKMRFTAQNLTDQEQFGSRGVRGIAPTLWNSSGVRYEFGITANWD